MKHIMIQGDCLEILEGYEDDTFDAIITDPPYGERTHTGHDKSAENTPGREQLGYSYLDPLDIVDLAPHFARVAKGWIVVMTCHNLAGYWEHRLKQEGLYTFAPFPWVAPGSRVRLSGDGPANWAVWIIAARPRREPWSKWGSLPGAYVITQDRRKDNRTGGKPIELMRRLVCDYTEEGDRILDPFAGAGTTGVACMAEGRGFVGIECDPDTFEIALRRMAGSPIPVEGQGELPWQ